MDTLYIIVSNNINEPDSPYYTITVQRRPGVTNMSREPRERGWLGCTGGIDCQAMGEFTPNEAREFLRTWGVQLPDDVPVLRDQHNTHQYHSASKGVTGEREEAWNREFAYPWRGPWVDVPTEEMRWCREPHIIAETRVVPFSVYGDDEYQVVITGDEKSTYGWGTRSWHELDNSYPLMREEAERLAASLIGRAFDAGRCPVWTG